MSVSVRWNTYPSRPSSPVRSMSARHTAPAIRSLDHGMGGNAPAVQCRHARPLMNHEFHGEIRVEHGIESLRGVAPDAMFLRRAPDAEVGDLFVRNPETVPPEERQHRPERSGFIEARNPLAELVAHAATTLTCW